MAEDRSWVNAIVKWSDQFNLGLPKTYDELINLKVLSAFNKEVTYIPEEI